MSFDHLRHLPRHAIELLPASASCTRCTTDQSYASDYCTCLGLLSVSCTTCSMTSSSANPKQIKTRNLGQSPTWVRPTPY